MSPWPCSACTITLINLEATPAPGEGTLQLDILRALRPEAAWRCKKGAAYAGAATSIAAFDRAFQHLLAARPQLCTASEVQRVLCVCVWPPGWLLEELMPVAGGQKRKV